jgi:inhibitor of KinA sporulation pathway (predicted exonuclease)
LSTFCTKLTGITQKTVDAGCAFPEAHLQHEKWMRKCIPNFDTSDVRIMTMGRWDMNTQFPKDVIRWNIDPKKIHKVYKKYVNIKDLFGDFLMKKGLLKSTKGFGMKGMLEFLDLTLDGRHHSGIDDCKNTMKILEKLVKMGATTTDMIVYESDFFRKKKHQKK